MTLAEVTPMVMSGIALTGLLLQAFTVHHRSKDSQARERVASWSGLNNALDRDNQQLRATILQLQQQLATVKQELNVVRDELVSARRRLAMLEEGRDDRHNPRPHGG